MRFVRLLTVDARHLPGERLRLEYDNPAIGKAVILACETVHPEQVDNADAHHFVTHDLLDLDENKLRWLHEVTGELLSTLELQHAERVEPGQSMGNGADDETTVDAKFDKGGE